MHPMAHQLVAATRGMAAMDFTDLPSIAFIAYLRKNLIELSFSTADAESLASRIDVRLPQGAITQEQLIEVAENYSIVIAKIRDALCEKGFANPTLALVEMASKMNIHLSE